MSTDNLRAMLSNANLGPFWQDRLIPLIEAYAAEAWEQGWLKGWNVDPAAGNPYRTGTPSPAAEHDPCGCGWTSVVTGCEGRCEPSAGGSPPAPETGAPCSWFEAHDETDVDQESMWCIHCGWVRSAHAAESGSSPTADNAGGDGVEHAQIIWDDRPLRERTAGDLGLTGD